MTRVTAGPRSQLHVKRFLLNQTPSEVFRVSRIFTQVPASFIFQLLCYHFAMFTPAKPAQHGHREERGTKITWHRSGVKEASCTSPGAVPVPRRSSALRAACASNTSPESQMGWQHCCCTPGFAWVPCWHHASFTGPIPVPVLLFLSFWTLASCPSCGQPGSTTAGLTSKVSSAEPCLHAQELLCPDKPSLSWHMHLCFLALLVAPQCDSIAKTAKACIVTFWQWDISGNPAESSGKSLPCVLSRTSLGVQAQTTSAHHSFLCRNHWCAPSQDKSIPCDWVENPEDKMERYNQ